AGRSAALRLHFRARDVYVVLGGNGTVRASIDGRLVGTIRVGGTPRLYTVARRAKLTRGLLELRFTARIQAYSFTFG
ncbi:MAG: cytochrome c biogenesis protein DipZ, partial [Actinobacteria bacterium]|nr:cytochrome c biogenesis protein DipZ [Actinomycetota bacterium]